MPWGLVPFCLISAFVETIQIHYLGSTAYRTVIELNVPRQEARMNSRQYKLQYRVHDPNTPDATADYLAKLFVEVNRRKVDSLVQGMLDKQLRRPDAHRDDEDHINV